MQGHRIILGIESSCDDTAAAVVRAQPGRAVGDVLANEVIGQDALHAEFGGVVPEIAARAHAERLDHATAAALRTAGVSFADLDAVAVTAGPGLIGGVLAGVMFAKGIAAGRGLPLWGVNHLAGHALTPRLVEDVAFPYLVLLVSGGHCQFLAVEGPEAFRRLGGTIDDAPGEAFDKVAKLLGLGQPGGPAVEAEAAAGDAARFALPRPLIDRDGCDLSFSGLKTAVRRARDLVVEAKGGLTRADRADLCAGFQAAVAETLAEKTRRATAGLPRPPPGRAGGAGRRGRRRGQRRGPRRAGGGRRGRAGPVPGPAAGALHRQRRDDRLGGGGADGGGGARRPRAGGPAALAARRGGAADARRRPQGGQGVIAVIGAGAFGTALAVAEAAEGREVRLWGRDAAAMAEAERARRAPRLPDAALPETLRCVSDLAELRAASAVLLALPAQVTGTFLSAQGAALPSAPVVLCAKGIDAGGLGLQTEIAAASAPGRDLAALTGPGFAAEIARGLPTALTLACADPRVGRELQAGLATRRLRLYLTDDVIGAQLGGALKNVIAIACGMVEGAGLGASARAALMTRGFAEMTRLAVALGARPETLAGLSGLGDLSLTCNSAQSRNFALGRALGAGEGRPGGTVEGVATARAACELGGRHEVELPIAAAVADVLEGAMTIEGAMQALLARPLREE